MRLLNLRCQDEAFAVARKELDGRLARWKGKQVAWSVTVDAVRAREDGVVQVLVTAHGRPLSPDQHTAQLLQMVREDRVLACNFPYSEVRFASRQTNHCLFVEPDDRLSALQRGDTLHFTATIRNARWYCDTFGGYRPPLREGFGVIELDTVALAGNR
jgi:hypothetical protein